MAERLIPPQIQARPRRPREAPEALLLFLLLLALLVTLASFVMAYSPGGQIFETITESQAKVVR